MSRDYSKPEEPSIRGLSSFSLRTASTLFLALCIPLLALGACSTAEEEDRGFSPAIIPGALAKTGNADTLVLEGKIVAFLYELSSEDCFNEYRLVDDRTGDISDLTTNPQKKRGCDNKKLFTSNKLQKL